MSKVAPKQFAVQGKVFLYRQPIEFIFHKPVLFKISYVDKGMPEKFTQGGTTLQILEILICIGFCVRSFQVLPNVSFFFG